MLARVKLVLRAAAALVAFLLYVWYRAVLAVPGVRRRKRARRVERRANLRTTRELAESTPRGTAEAP